MHRIRDFVVLCMVVFLPGCLISPMRKKKASEATAVQPTTVAVDERLPSETHYYTFLDTINRGNELLLSEVDFEKNGQTTEIVGSLVQPSTETRYRVQVLASNRIETAREQKKELEKNIKENIVIGYEAPYYKLYAGSFIKRQDAQVVLLKLKKLGFLDAWIVSTNLIPKN